MYRKILQRQINPFRITFCQLNSLYKPRLRLITNCTNMYFKPAVFSHNLKVTSFISFSAKFNDYQTPFNRSLSITTSKNQIPTMPEIRFDDVKKGLEAKSITFVDVREPKELTSDGKIPGSVNIPLGELDAAFQLPPEKVIEKYGKALPPVEEAEKLVLSCRSGRRAASAFDIAAKHGYQKAYCYFGSFLDWVEKSGPLEK